ncbi:MAG TPA: hypothetical protein VE914_10200 [Candidatus Angelobacter sp.]|nr:hypothetical protein [Candidatus Angelobacter sp.]
MKSLTRRALVLAAGTAAAAGLAIPALADSPSGPDPLTSGLQLAAATPASGKVAETKAALRDLWMGHIFWVRGVVFATLAKNGPAATAAEQAVVGNAKDIGAAIAPFYGQPAADKLFSLLAGHYGAIKEYLEAAVKKDAAAESKATDHLTANAQAIAAFLSGANPNLPKDTLEELLLAHGGHHLQQIQEVQAGQYEKEAATWSAMKGHIYVIADALTDALAKQFPEKF